MPPNLACAASDMAGTRVRRSPRRLAQRGPWPGSCHVCSCRVEARPARFRPGRFNASLVPPFSYVAGHLRDVACSSRLMAWPRILLRWGRRPQVRWCMDVALRSGEWTWRSGRARPWPGSARLQPAPDPSLTSRPVGTCGALASPRACAALRRASARARSVRRLRVAASIWSISLPPSRYDAGVAAKRARICAAGRINRSRAILI